MAENLMEQDGKWFDENGVRVWRAGTLVYYKKDLIDVPPLNGTTRRVSNLRV